MMSSVSTAQLLLQISQQFVVYFSSILLLPDFIGNICIVIVFFHVKSFRRNQCAFYIIVGSIADFLFLLVILPFHIIQNTSGYDPLRLSLAWCKISYAIISIFSLLSFSVVCFAAIDQYLSTHYNPWLRQFSTLKLAHRLVYSAVVILSLYGIPFLIFFDIQSPGGCGIYNAGFSRYFSLVHFCVLSGVLPNTIAGFSAALAYLNVRRIVRRQIPIARRRLDRQLTAMILIRVVFLVVTTVPFVIDRIYIYNRTISPNDSLRLAVEQLLFSITSSLFYVNSAVSTTIFIEVFIFLIYLGGILCIFMGVKTISSTSETYIYKTYLGKINSHHDKQ